jgi:hypothetical protein
MDAVSGNSLHTMGFSSRSVHITTRNFSANINNPPGGEFGMLLAPFLGKRGREGKEMTNIQIENLKTKLNIVTETLGFLKDLSRFREIDPSDADPMYSLMLIDKILDERIENIKRIIQEIG